MPRLIYFILFCLFMFAMFLFISFLTRGERTATWEAEYTENRDGTGKRLSKSGTFYANRSRDIPPGIEINGEFDMFMYLVTKIPMWKKIPYYLDSHSIRVIEDNTIVKK